MIARVVVGWTSSRPIVVDEHASMVLVSADCATLADLPRAENDAVLQAIAIVCARPACEMPTSAQLIELLEV
jgi:hypothetical protein